MNNMKNYNEKELFPPIIAIDFDGTLVTNKFPEIGDINQKIWQAVKAYQGIGYKVILWTCRTDWMLEDAVSFCKANGLEFDAVNQNIPEVQEYYKGDTRKVFANMYVDDRSAALFVSGGNTIESMAEFAPFSLIN